MKVGSNNESMVLGALPSFFKVAVAEWALNSRRSSVFEWKEGVQVGLVCLRAKPYMGTSVDMLARVVVTNIPEAAHNMARRSDVDCTENLCAFCDNSSTFEFCLFPCLKGTCAQHALEGMQSIQPPLLDENVEPPLAMAQYLMCVEVKSATTEERVQEELHLVQQHFKFIFIDITQDSDLFKRVIPKSAHRVQCVQHCIAFNANLVLYVVSDTGVVGIIRCVLLLVPNPFKAAYMQIFDQMTAQHLSWVHGTPTENIPHLSQERLGYLQSMDVLKFHVHLWQALFRYVSTHGPITDVQAIVPTMVSVWNLVKNGGDLYSRLLNNAKPVHKKLPSRAKIALRGLYSMLYQTYQTERIWVTLKVLADPKYTITTYSKLRATVTETMQSFQNICREIASSMTMDMFNFIHTSDPTIPQALPATSKTAPVCKEGKNSKCIPTRKQIALLKVKV